MADSKRDSNRVTSLLGLSDSLGTAQPIGAKTVGSYFALDVAVVDASGDQVTFSGILPITGISHGVKTVTTAGTDVALAASTTCKRVVVQAQTSNTGLIAVGGSGVDATEATGTGVILYPGDWFELDIANLASVHIDSTVSGDGVRYTYFT